MKRLFFNTFPKSLKLGLELEPIGHKGTFSLAFFADGFYKKNCLDQRVHFLGKVCHLVVRNKRASSQPADA